MYSRRRFLKICASSVLTVSCLELMFFQSTTSSGIADSKIPVLLYHRVGNTTCPLTVTPERFAADLDKLLAHGYKTITLEQFNNFRFDRNVTLPEQPILITFDDGYLDNYQNAYPILRSHGMTAAFFIITDMLWDENRIKAQHIIEMAQNGMSFGSHTATHRALASLSEQDILTELDSSRYTLERILKAPVTSIAYPRGSYNEVTTAAAENLGYTLGFTTKHGLCSKYSPQYELPRIPIFRYDGDIISLIAKRSKA